MKKYILVDHMNLFFRARHAMHPSADLLDKVGMAMHTMLASANKIVKASNVDHVVFCLEGGNNWRKTFYEPYKKQRAVLRQQRTNNEIEEDDLYFEMYNELTAYLKEKTNCSVISQNGSEADDVIARWIHLHPDDEHVILSSDTDYYQLITDKVTQYNGIMKHLITLDGTYDDNGKPVIDKKTKEPKCIGDPDWLLFEKCIRGDKSDNIFSAYPGVRKKGSKNKTGLLEAYADKNKKGFDWNNLMLQRWVDHHEVEHKVLDDYERNRTLIDLTLQPQNIKDDVDLAICDHALNSISTQMPANQISFAFLKFCGKHELIKLSEYPNDYVKWLAKPYAGHLADISTEDLKAWNESKQKL